jgi:hypothetical protein
MFENIPRDCKSIIFSYLNHLQHASLSAINKETYHIINGPTDDNFKKIEQLIGDKPQQDEIINTLCYVASNQTNGSSACELMSIDIRFVSRFISKPTLNNYRGVVSRLVSHAANIKHLRVEGSLTFKHENIRLKGFIHKMCPRLNTLILGMTEHAKFVNVDELLVNPQSSFKQLFCFINYRYGSEFYHCKHQYFHPSCKFIHRNGRVSRYVEDERIDCDPNITKECITLIPEIGHTILKNEKWTVRQKNIQHIANHFEKSLHFCLPWEFWYYFIKHYKYHEELLPIIGRNSGQSDSINNTEYRDGVPLLDERILDMLLAKIHKRTTKQFFRLLLKNGASQSSFCFDETRLPVHKQFLTKIGFRFNHAERFVVDFDKKQTTIVFNGEEIGTIKIQSQQYEVSCVKNYDNSDSVEIVLKPVRKPKKKAKLSHE